MGILSFNNQIGLNEEDLEKIIDAHLDENADLLIGIDDPEVQEMIDVLKVAIIHAIAANNSQIEQDLRNL